MPWIQISANGEELDRQALSAAVVIGRSSECDIVVRDILLSRTHCRIEPIGDGWRVVDLNSKNGTRVGWQDLRLHVLRDGDHLRMGRTRIVYHTGPFEPAATRKNPRIDRIVRPADPHEALTGTVTDFILLDEEEAANPFESYTDHPYPQPRPLDPAAENEACKSAPIADDVVSSFWCRQGESSADSIATADAATVTAIVATPRLTMRALPRKVSKPIYREIPARSKRAAETDLSLQADVSVAASPVETFIAPKRSRRQRVFAGAGMILAAALSTGIVMMSIWLLTLAA